jgi:hypothetical protein
LKASKDRRATTWRKLNRSKELKMFRKRLFNLSMAVALLTTLTFTVREALATSALISRTRTTVDCASLPSPFSIHSKYIEKAKMWVLYTEDGPVGVEGGLKELASAYRTCSR